MRKIEVARLARHGLAAGFVGLLGTGVWLVHPRQLSAHGYRTCGNETLRGDYGFLASGRKALPPPPFGPGGTESFTASGIWSFDGSGTFTHAAGNGLHGELSGTNPDSTGLTGEYEVDANCNGTMLFQPPGPVPPLQWTIVIVSRGQQVFAANTSGLSTVEMVKK
jgi:hypothetical protein